MFKETAKFILNFLSLTSHPHSDGWVLHSVYKKLKVDTKGFTF